MGYFQLPLSNSVGLVTKLQGNHSLQKRISSERPVDSWTFTFPYLVFTKIGSMGLEHLLKLADLSFHFGLGKI